MAITVNGIEITDAAIEEEIGYHQAAAHPTQAAVQELILQTLLQQEVIAKGLQVDMDNEVSLLDALLANEANLPNSEATGSKPSAKTTRTDSESDAGYIQKAIALSLIHISEPTRPY